MSQTFKICLLKNSCFKNLSTSSADLNSIILKTPLSPSQWLHIQNPTTEKLLSPTLKRLNKNRSNVRNNKATKWAK